MLFFLQEFEVIIHLERDADYQTEPELRLQSRDSVTMYIHPWFSEYEWSCQSIVFIHFYTNASSVHFNNIHCLTSAIYIYMQNLFLWSY